MPNSDKLSQPARASVAEQLRTFLPRMRHLPPGGPGTNNILSESYRIFTFPAHCSASDVATCAADTGAWYHQILSVADERSVQPVPSVVGAARSIPTNADHHSVLAVTESFPGADLPERIYSAAVWIDSVLKEKATARILEIPARYITCFWIILKNNSVIVVADRPESSNILRMNYIYQETEFLNELRSCPIPVGLGAP